MTKRTPQLESAILAGFAEGQSLNAVCRALGVSRTAFLTWKLTDPQLAQRYEMTQLLHAEALMDDCLEIAEDALSATSGEAMRHARLRIETRLKVARLHLKRHEAALERRAAEAERREAELAAEPEPAAPPEAHAGKNATQVAPDRPATGQTAKPLRLAAASEAHERRHAGAPG